jgi:hypothetical protein
MLGTGIFQLFLPSSTINININYRPVNKEELFNVCHTSAQNIIKHIFGVLKWCFQILHFATDSLKIQAQIPAALCTIHNFICMHNMGNTLSEPEFMDDMSNNHDHDTLVAAEAETAHLSKRHNIIAQQMWEDYMNICSERGINEDENNQSDDEYRDIDGEDEGDDLDM